MTAWSTRRSAQRPGSRLDPRVERSRRVILEAVLDELGEVGYGALTIEGVAARAGVGKSTIYRHWPGKLELVEDAFRTLKAPVVVPEAGTLRERVVGFLEQVAASSRSRPTRRACRRSSTPPSATRRCATSTTASAPSAEPCSSTSCATASESGELPATTDPELLADALVGPILLRRLMLGQPVRRARRSRRSSTRCCRPRRPPTEAALTGSGTAGHPARCSSR